MNGQNRINPIDIRKIDRKGRITIPLEVREKINAKRFFIFFDEDSILLEAMK